MPPPSAFFVQNVSVAFGGNGTDSVIMRTVDILVAFPGLLLIIVVISYLRAVLDQWKDTKRAVEIELILDRSGSMQGERITAARASEKASSEKLESEIRLFQTGESTNFLVLTRQNELLDSRRRVVEALLLQNRAVSRLQQVLGMTLEAYKVTLD